MREALIALATLLFAATLFMLLGKLGAIIVEQSGFPPGSVRGSSHSS